MHEDQRYEITRILEEMRSDYWRNLETVEEGANTSWVEYLVVRYDGKRFGLPASSCREVLKLPRLLRVPRLPEHLPGIFNLRGEILAVTDLRPLLGLSSRQMPEHSRLVVVEHAEVKTALLVEAVERLSRIDADEVEPLAEGSGATARDLVVGKVVRGETVIVLLDLGGLMKRPEMVVDQKSLGEGA